MIINLRLAAADTKKCVRPNNKIHTRIEKLKVVDLHVISQIRE